MVVSGRLTPFLLEMRPATSTMRVGAAGRDRRRPAAAPCRRRSARDGPARASSRISGCGRRRALALPGVGSESSGRRRPCAAATAPFGEFADAQLRPLQIDENADRPVELLLERANHRDPLAHGVVRGVAHVDAKDVGAGLEQRGDGRPIGRGRAERGDDLDAASTSDHKRLLQSVRRPAGESLQPALSRSASSRQRDASGNDKRRDAQGLTGSVSCTVQFLASLPVSTSKNPVRS